ncbi:MAG TPA: HNH endonuclease signature motif containing protein, partial [Acidimicrobiales bacterium]
DADCAEAKERLGRRPRIDELARDAGQRRADALVEMATRSRSNPADGIRPAPLFSVFVGYETIHGRICELENGTVLHPSALSPWMDSAYFERAIFSLSNRIDVSVRARLFTGGTRRAIELRDRICTHPHCYEPAESCQVDHIETYAEGGLTTQENGRLLCGFHNRLRNQREAKGEQRQRPPPTAA